MCLTQPLLWPCYGSYMTSLHHYLTYAISPLGEVLERSTMQFPNFKVKAQKRSRVRILPSCSMPRKRNQSLLPAVPKR